MCGPPRKCVCLIGLAIVWLAATIEGARPPRAEWQAASAGLTFSKSLLFAENRGQADAPIRYVARAGGRLVALTENEAVLKLGGGASGLRTIRLRFLGAADDPEITATDAAPDPLYFSPAHVSGPAVAIPQFHRVTYADLYPGVN